VHARAGLTRDRVVDAAAALLADEGEAGLTLTRLAARLGVKPPSLYAHVAGLDDLRRALRLRGFVALRDTLRASAVGRARRDALTGLAGAYLAFARAHPGLYGLTLATAEDDDETVRGVARSLMETVLSVLRGYLLEGDDAVHAARILRSTLHGFASLELAGGFGLPQSLDETRERLVAALDEAFAAMATRSLTTRA
jgi:AcrR family transcriptional regulator